jgi:hypothetical protein
MIVLAIFFSAVLSFSMSLWWTVEKNDISGGFTMGSWILAVATLPIGFANYRHSTDCQCWKKRSIAQEQSTALDAELGASGNETEGTLVLDPAEDEAISGENTA